MNRPVRLTIDRITVSAASGLEARRLADALPGALEQAMRRTIAGAEAGPALVSPAERAAAEVAAAVAQRLEPFR